MPTEMEQTLEQTQQGVSYEVSVNEIAIDDEFLKLINNPRIVTKPCHFSKVDTSRVGFFLLEKLESAEKRLEEMSQSSPQMGDEDARPLSRN
ncbi:hypothetical protein Tco_1301200 [Tanacetum coccineum]